MPERRRYLRGLTAGMVDALELSIETIILPPNASEVFLHLVDPEKFEHSELRVHPACLGALVIATVSVVARADVGHRVVGAVSFKATAEDVATSPHEFRHVSEPRASK